LRIKSSCAVQQYQEIAALRNIRWHKLRKTTHGSLA